MHLINRFFRLLEYMFEALKYIILYPFAMLYYRKRHIRIFSERGTDARDNAYHLYSYYRQNHPELEAYYIITKDSADRSKVAELGNVVNYRSLKHYMLFIAAEYKISTHIMGYSPNMAFYYRFGKFFHIKGHRVFLQHGVIKDDIPMLYSKNTNVDIFICGAQPEFDFVQDTYGYQHNEVKYTGLARYDRLHDIKLKRQILCMPTWRQFLQSMPAAELAKSEYVKAWNGLLNNQELISALRETGLKLVFYPHYNMQKYLSAFQTNYDEIVIADFNNYDVQQLLKESRLLITDYSSVYFDFAYMKKPVVYYQFDYERFTNEHYRRGYFDYETMGFGEVVFDEKDAIKTILSYINRDFLMNAEYMRRTEDFFPLHDQQNCQRIFDEIESL